MKIKNATFIEKHIEKIVLGVTGLYFLVCFLIFVVNPFQVEIKEKRKTQHVSIYEVEEKIRKEAYKLSSNLSKTRGPLDGYKIVGYSKIFEARQNMSLVDEDRYRLPFSRSGLAPRLLDEDGSQGDRLVFSVATPHAPQDLKVISDYAVLMSGDMLVGELDQRLAANERGSRRAVQVAEQYKKLLGDAQPGDFRYVSLSAEFDMEQWEQMLLSPLPGKRIPDRWRRNRLAIADVILERQMLDPVTGRWPDNDEMEVIAPLPDALNFRQLTTSDHQWLSGEGRKIISEIRLASERIVRPEFVPTTETRFWLPPSQKRTELTTQQQKQLFSINRAIKRLTSQLERKRSQHTRELEEGRLPRSSGRPNSPRSSLQGVDSMIASLGVGGAMGAQGKGGSSQRNKRNRRDNNAERAKPRRQTLDEQIRELEERLTLELEKQSLLLGEDGADATRGRNRSRAAVIRQRQGVRGGLGRPGSGFSSGLMAAGSSFPGVMGGPGSIFPGGMLGPGANLPGSMRGPNRRVSRPGERIDEEGQRQKIELWANDITVEPGMTYRYRLRVAVLNPLFLQPRLDPNQKKQMGNHLALLSHPTPWTKPVAIEPTLHFFVVEANRSSQRAKVEVFCIYDARRHMRKFTTTPGDPIGDQVKIRYVAQGRPVQAVVDMQIDVVAVDIDARSGKTGSNSILVYYDRRRNVLTERIVEEDRNNPMLIKLRNEVAQVEAEDKIVRATPAAMR